MPVLKCPYANCEETITNDDKEIAIALFNAHVGTHTSARQVEQKSMKSEKIARPKISQGLPEEGWNSFLIQWKLYKTSAGLSATESKLQLIYCCDQELIENVLRSDPNIIEKDETDQLSSIRKLSVVPVAMGVRRSEMLNLTQDAGELSRSFLARIQGKAATCDFSTKCLAKCCETTPSNVDFSTVIVKYVLVNGLVDAEIKREVLGWKELDSSSLPETVAFIENKEMARDAYKGDVSAVKSAYKSQSKDPKLKLKIKCESCETMVNQYVQLRSGKMVERKFCGKCWKARSNKKADIKKKDESPPADETSSMFMTGGIYSVEDDIPKTTRHKGKLHVVLSHHIFEDGRGWMQKSAESQPMLKLNLSPCEEMYSKLDIGTPSVADAQVEGLADTGAQSCLWGMKEFYKCGFKRGDLVPVKHSMVVANREQLDIKGALFLEVRAADQIANVMVYVSPDVRGFYMSRQCLKQLGVISRNFPLPGEMLSRSENAGVHSFAEGGEVIADCGCLKRTKPPKRPEVLPMECIPENIPAMKNWLVNKFASSTFNRCTHQPLPFIKAEPMRFHVDKNAKPVAHHSPAIVPLHFRDKVKEQLDADERLGVIERVPEGVPTTWLHRLVIAAKPNGEPRRTIDLSRLNKHSSRETHASTPPFQQARLIPPDTWKTVTDAWNGFHSALIAEEDRHYTSFLTEWGQYRYRVAPQGYVSSTDGYSRRYDKIIEPVKRKTKIIDDTALWDKILEEHWWRTIDYLILVGTHGIVLNADKFQFCQREVDFGGFRITENRVEPLPKYLEAIETFPTPTKIQDVRSWFGLINQVAHYNQLSKIMAPFRPLLSSKAAFYWSDELQQAFEASKKLIISAIREGVEIFDVSRPTMLRSDFSTTGIGYYLSQKHCSCPDIDPDCCSDGWKMTLAGSRFLKPAETRYAPIEGEAKGVEWSLDQTRYFTLGCDKLLVVVDHKPLCGLFNDKSLEDITNTRLLKIKEKTLKWKFTVMYRPGKKNFFADFASRNPRTEENSVDVLEASSETPASEGPVYSSSPQQGFCLSKEESQDEISLVSSVSAMFRKQLPFKAVTWELVKSVSKSDEPTQQIFSYVANGFPAYKNQLPPNLQGYWAKRDSLYNVDGVLMAGSSVVIPGPLRPAVLEVLGSAHQGVAAMKKRAADAVYWPNITSDIEDYKKNCQVCREIQPSQVHNTHFEPRIPKTPFESLVADYFDLEGHHYLVIADRLSGWSEIIQIKQGSKDTGAGALCKGLRDFFARFGVPADISTDGGPEFVARETQNFFKSWGIIHKLSSSYYPTSNGRAELAVKSAKRLLRDNVKKDGSVDTDKFVRAMLTKRNTPDSYSKLSPAEIIMGKKLNDALPYLPSEKMFTVNPNIDKRWREMWEMKENALRDRFVRNLEAEHKSDRHLKPLKVGQFVAIQNQHGTKPLRWDRTGVVVMCMDYDQYIVKVHGSNRITRRNRKFLRAYDPSEGVQLVIPSFNSDSSLNKGAGDVVSDSVQVEKPHHQVYKDIVPTDLNRHVPPVENESPIMGRNIPFVESERQPIGLEVDSQPHRAVQGNPVLPDDNSDRCPPAATNIGLRRSTRANRGESSKFKDFLTGSEYEDAVKEASKD